MAREVLIIDDERDIRDMVAGILEDEGYETRVAGTADDALTALKDRRPALVLMDIWLEGSRMDGLELLDRTKRDHPDVPVVMISGHGNIETAVSAIRKGAYDYLEKPFKADRLLLMADRAVEAAVLRRENRELRQRAGHEDRLIGSSSAINTVKNAVGRIAPTGSRVLITGPAGAGKEVLARMIHGASRRGNGPFVVLNAANMEPDRLESELFGEEEGDGAGVRKIGVFEQAHGGTLLFDEVADMPLESQGKILRVLVDQTFVRLGGSTPIEVDVRVISATSHDLMARIQEGLFREDLYHRLNVVPIRMPALSERREDIPELVDYFVRRSAESLGLPARQIGPDAMATLQAHDWPGNGRELRNMIERLLIMAPGDSTEPISVEMLPPEVIAPTPLAIKSNRDADILTLPLRDAREMFEREYLSAQITRFGGNISRTAEFVGMERSALHRKLRLLGLNSRLVG